MDVHQISPQVIKTIHKSLCLGEVSIRDGRGQHLNRPHTNSQQLKDSILQHIRRFPTYETHYARNNYPSHYLSPDLSIDRMFKKFCDENPTIPHVTSKESLYRSILRGTGLKIGCHQKDTCKTCDLLHIKLKSASTAVDRAIVERDQNFHHKQAEFAQNAYHADVEKSRRDPNYVVKVVDLQQV